MKICAIFLLVVIPVFCLAENVVPIDSVRKHVNVRLLPDASSEIVGRLKQGDSMRLISAKEGWYEVALDGDASGYISADWTKLDGQDSDNKADGEIAADESRVDTAPEKNRSVEKEAILEIVETQDINVDVVDSVVIVTDEVADEVAEELGPESDKTAEVEPTPATEPPQAAAAIKGTRNFLIRFREQSEGGNSQIYDDGNRIGIGTTAPKQRLEVNGSIQIHEQNSSVAGLMITQSTGETGYIMHNRASTLTIGAGSKDRITIDRDGNVGFAVSRPDHPLEMASGAHATAGGVWTNSSSRDRKENIVALSGELAESALLALKPVQFKYKNEPAEHYVGFIAEDVPELVATSERDSLSTMDIVAVLTRVVQEQQVRIDALERRLGYD